MGDCNFYHCGAWVGDGLWHHFMILEDYNFIWGLVGNCTELETIAFRSLMGFYYFSILGDCTILWMVQFALLWTGADWCLGIVPLWGW